MTYLVDIIKYFCKNYPHENELSNARLTKMVYLADWESCKINRKQITDINWYFDNYGPYVDDIKNTAMESNDFIVENIINLHGTPKTLININPGAKINNLSESDIFILNKVINDTRRLFWNDFIKYVYSTEPIKNNPRYKNLDLVKASKDMNFN